MSSRGHGTCSATFVFYELYFREERGEIDRNIWGIILARGAFSIAHNTVRAWTLGSMNSASCTGCQVATSLIARRSWVIVQDTASISGWSALVHLIGRHMYSYTCIYIYVLPTGDSLLDHS